METIAVTKDQAKALLAEAKKRAKKTKVEGGYKAYFKHVRGAVPIVTHTGSSCAGHQLVSVVCGLRKCAGITHKSQGNVLFASGTKLARSHPRGVACYMKWTTPPAAPETIARRRQAPAGFHGGTIPSRSAAIEAGSRRQQLTVYMDVAQGNVDDYDIEIVRELENALEGTRYFIHHRGVAGMPLSADAQQRDDKTHGHLEELCDMVQARLRERARLAGLVAQIAAL
jgi:hypothetical protein